MNDAKHADAYREPGDHIPTAQIYPREHFLWSVWTLSSERKPLRAPVPSPVEVTTVLILMSVIPTHVFPPHVGSSISNVRGRCACLQSLYVVSCCPFPSATCFAGFARGSRLVCGDDAALEVLLSEPPPVQFSALRLMNGGAVSELSLHHTAGTGCPTCGRELLSGVHAGTPSHPEGRMCW